MREGIDTQATLYAVRHEDGEVRESLRESVDVEGPQRSFGEQWLVENPPIISSSIAGVPEAGIGACAVANVDTNEGTVTGAVNAP